MPKSIYFGKMELRPGDCVSVLISGRTYILKIEEITDYNQIVGEDILGSPVMIRVSKIMALKKISEEEFELRKGEKKHDGNTTQ